MEGLGWQVPRDSRPSVFEEEISIEDLLEFPDNCQQGTNSSDQQPVLQQIPHQSIHDGNFQQSALQDFTFAVGSDERNLQQLLHLQSESDALLNSFASELLSHRNVHAPQEHAKFEDLSAEDSVNVHSPEQVEQLGQTNISYLDQTLANGTQFPTISHVGQIYTPSPSPSATSISAYSSCGVTSEGTTSGFEFSDVDSPQITEDFDEMALIPETLQGQVPNDDTKLLVANNSSPTDTKLDIATTVQESKDFPVCPVCGNKAGKHSYYGGQVCNSCRAFFRRSVQNKTYLHFNCKKEGACPINSRSWKSCQFCRFQKCQGAGMKTSWVLTEPERKARAKQRADTKMKKQEKHYRQVVAASTLSTMPDYPTLRRQPEELFTEDDRSHILRLIDTTHDYLFIELCKFYTRHVTAFEESMNSFYKGGIISQRSLNLQEDFLVYSVKNFYRGMGDMMNLSGRDQNLLVTKNYPLIMEFFQSIFLDAAQDCQMFIDGFVSKMRDSRENKDMVALEEKFNELSLSNSLKARPLKYEQMHQKDSFKDKEAQERHMELCLKVKEWPRHKKEDSSDDVIVTVSSRNGSTVDEIQYMLLALVMLFSTDFIELDDPSCIASIQTRYGSLLYRYLKGKYRARSPGVGMSRDRATKAALAKYCQGMLVSSMSREMREIKEMHGKNS